MDPSFGGHESPFLNVTLVSRLLHVCLQFFIIITRCPGHFLPQDERDKQKPFYMSERKMSKNVKPTIRLNKNQFWKYRLGEEELVTCLCSGHGRALK